MTEPDERDPLQALTLKQRQVLDLLIQHKTSKEISRLLGISPHTVDQRIMLARAKLQVATRNEVAQAYRHLLESQDNPGDPGLSDQSIYGFSDMAPAPGLRQTGLQEGMGYRDATSDWSDHDTAETGLFDLDRAGPYLTGPALSGEDGAGGKGTNNHDSGQPALTEMTRTDTALSAPSLVAERSYHVLPEVFDGENGTILRLGAIAMIAIFVTLVIMGGFAMFSELARIIDG